MSKLADRFRRLQRPSPSRTESRGGGETSELRERLDRLLGPGRVVPAAQLGPRPERATVDQVVAGRRVKFLAGPTFLSEWSAPAGYRHGELPIEELARVPPQAARELFPDSFRDVTAPEQVAFLDTETTGLSGGAGTIPFLVGVGRWSPEAGGFRVALYFLEDLDREPALLEAVGRELEGVRCLVTYNGRSFDVPLLENRHVLARRAWPLSDAAHLDLLYPARTLWRHEHPDCRLATLEHRILGYERHNDIPGSEIPALYNHYLRRGASQRMAAVFRHNRDDILSLAGLLWAIGKIADAGTGRAAAGVGLIHARRGRHDRARPALEASLAEDLPRDLRWAALRQLSLALKRESDWDRALDAWEEMRGLRPADPFPVVEAAKALEHHVGRLGSALALVEKALASAAWPPQDREALEYRRARLGRKVAAMAITHR